MKYLNFILILFVLASTVTISAQTPGWYYIKSAVGDKYMTVLDDRDDNGAPIVIANYDGTSKQLFEIVEAEPGYVNIKTATGNCIAIQNASTSKKAKIVSWDFHNQSNTQWNLKAHILPQTGYPGHISIISKVGTAIDVPNNEDKNNLGLWMWSPNNGRAQMWHFIKGDSKEAYDANSYSVCDTKPLKLKSVSSKCLTMNDNKNRSRYFDSRVSAKGFVRLSIVNSVQIEAEINLNLKGTKDGSAHLEKTWKEILYTAPNGSIIEGISTSSADDYNRYALFCSFSQSLKESGTEFGFGCNDGEKHTIIVSEVNGYLTVIGDTGSEDISDDNDCKCDARFESLTFDNIYIKLRGINTLKCLSNSENICGTLKTRNNFNYVLYDPTSGIKLQKDITRITAQSCEVIPSAKFVFEKSGNKFFKIKSSDSGKYLEVKGNQVVFENSSVIDNQLWKFETIGKLENMRYSYRIQNPATGQYLHAEYGTLGLTTTPGVWWSAMWAVGDCDCVVLL